MTRVIAMGFALLAGLVLVRPVCADWPYNGGFEQIDKGLPVGWTASGTWLVLTQAPYEGKKSASLPGQASRAGNRLVSEGYRLAEPGEVLTLRLAYLSKTGGAVAGLIPCDALGAPLKRGLLSASLPASREWTVTEKQFTLDPEDCPAGTAAVRVYVGAGEDKADACFDSVTVRGEAPAPRGGGLGAPRIDAYTRPNLLSNPTFRTSPGGALPGWSLLSAPGFADEAEPGSEGGVVLRGGKQPLAWVSAPVGGDLSLPYEVSATRQEDSGEGFSVLARVRDPAEPASIWLQTSSRPRAGDDRTMVFHLPRLAQASRTGLIEVVLLMAPGGEPVTVTSAALRPEPVSLGIRPVAMAGEFTRLQDVQLFVSAVNNTDRKLAPMAHLKVIGADQQAAYYEPRPVKIGPQSAGYFPVKPKLTSAGDYILLVRLIENGRDLGSATYAFKVTGG